MKTLVVVALSLLPLAAHAIGTVSNPTRSVSVSGSYVADPLADNLPTVQDSSSSSGFFSSSKSTGGTFESDDASGLPNGNIVKIEVESRQTSFISGNGFSFDSTTATGFSTQNASGKGTAVSKLALDMTFAEAHHFELTLTYTYSEQAGPFFGDTVVVLQGVGNYTYNASYGPPPAYVSLTGIIQPGTYHYEILMNQNTERNGQGLPQGSSGLLEALTVDLAFAKAALPGSHLVPDSGSTIVLFTAALGLLLAKSQIRRT